MTSVDHESQARALADKVARSFRLSDDWDDDDFGAAMVRAILPLARQALRGEALAVAWECEHQSLDHADDPQYLASPDDPPLEVQECPLDDCKTAAAILAARDAEGRAA